MAICPTPPQGGEGFGCLGVPVEANLQEVGSATPRNPAWQGGKAAVPIAAGHRGKQRRAWLQRLMVGNSPVARPKVGRTIAVGGMRANVWDTGGGAAGTAYRCPPAVAGDAAAVTPDGIAPLLPASFTNPAGTLPTRKGVSVLLIFQPQSHPPGDLRSKASTLLEGLQPRQRGLLH